MNVKKKLLTVITILLKVVRQTDGVMFELMKAYAPPPPSFKQGNVA